MEFQGSEAHNLLERIEQAPLRGSGWSFRFTFPPTNVALDRTPSKRNSSSKYLTGAVLVGGRVNCPETSLGPR